MFKNYLKIAIRSLSKNKLYSFVNIAGLAAGIVACLLIGLYVWNELSYDRFHANADRIVRVTSDLSFSGTRRQFVETGTKVGPQFKRTFPQIESYVRAIKYSRSVSIGTQSFEEKNVLYADADFFKTFSFNLLTGNTATALNAPQKAVITAAVAKKYFANENPIGKTLRFDGGDKQYEITGIAADAPLNSQIQYGIIVSFTSLRASQEEIWNTANYCTYLLLQKADQIKPLQASLTAYMQKVNRDEMDIQPNSGNYWTFHLEPLKTVHLQSKLQGGLAPAGNLTYVYVLSAIAILIMLIACVNYTNLATAQSANRGIEIGVRKVLGAGRPQLMKQFLGESFVVTFISLIIAFVACFLLLPLFNNITGKNFAVQSFLKPAFILAAIAWCALISLLSGAYPALILTNSKLINILKSGIRVSHSGGGLRKGLIVFQFVIAVFMIAVTMIVLQQINFIQNKNIGYNREQILVLPVDGKTKQVYAQLKDALKNTTGVVSVTGSYEDPTSIGWGDGISTTDEKGPKELSLNATPVDLDYIKTMGMQLAAGKDFAASDFALQDTSDNNKNYQASYILNEKAARDLGWTPEEAIGKIISRGAAGPVKAVVKDFHFESLHSPIGPLLIFLDTSLVQQLFIKINTEHTAQTIAALESVWQSRIAHRPFEYHFLDDDFNSLYNAEARIASLFSLFSTTAIVLACLGLFALAAFTTIQRTKEIGIRKILGANTASIIVLVGKNFLVLIGIAILIATPLAWWAGNSWLQNFAYRTDLQWWVFALAALATAFIAIVTVSYQAIKAAIANPVKSLRTE